MLKVNLFHKGKNKIAVVDPETGIGHTHDGTVVRPLDEKGTIRTNVNGVWDADGKELFNVENGINQRTLSADELSTSNNED